jgi:hypothetical protein
VALTDFKGIDVRATGARLVFRASLKDATGAKLTSGTTTLRLYELQDDGTLKSYDFNDNTFKTTALTTATLSMTHRQGNNSTHDTGFWTATLATLTGFTKDAIYLIQVNNSTAAPTDQEREFQFGGAQGDVVVSSAGVDTGLLAAIFAQVVTGTTTFIQGLRGLFAVMLGKSSGLGSTTAVYRDIADSKDVITATVDADGNRTAITRDLT